MASAQPLSMYMPKGWEYDRQTCIARKSQKHYQVTCSHVTTSLQLFLNAINCFFQTLRHLLRYHELWLELDVRPNLIICYPRATQPTTLLRLLYFQESSNKQNNRVNLQVYLESVEWCTFQIKYSSQYQRNPVEALKAMNSCTSMYNDKNNDTNKCMNSNDRE